jgi:TetR/AcrR family transcriptional regulator, transcriptional repressor for nem operon
MVAQDDSRQALETRERLLQTAFQLFHEQGYHATGVATILREAGVNAGSMYHFFSSKDDLLLKVLEFALGYLEPMVMAPAEAATDEPLERVFVLLNQYRDWIGANQCRMGCPIGNLALEVSDGNPQARELIHRNFENWAGRVEGWLRSAKGELPAGTDLRRLARFVLTVMEGGLMQARAAGHIGPFDDSVAVLREHFDVLRAQAAAARTGGARATKKASRTPNKTKRSNSR